MKEIKKKYILEPTEEELAEYTAMAFHPDFDDYSDAFQMKHYGKIVYSREEREKRRNIDIDEWNEQAIQEILRGEF